MRRFFVEQNSFTPDERPERNGEPMQCRNISCVCDAIVQMLSPKKIILFNLKQNVTGETRSFKLCVVSEIEDKDAAERRIYLEIECEVPFDVLIYTPEEWTALSIERESFAHRILEKGTVVYEQTP